MHFTTAFLSLLPVLSLLVAAAPSPAPEALNAFRVSPKQQAAGKRDGAFANAAGHGSYKRKIKRTLHKGRKRACTATSSVAPSATASTTLVADQNWANATSVVPSSTSSTAPAASSSSAAGSGEIYGNGYATFFYQEGNAGACGIVHSDSDLIGAIDQHWWPNFGVESEYCGRQVAITNTNNGKSVTITIADVCPTCETDNSIDLSEGAFKAIASLDDGMVPITWQWA